MEAGDDLVLSQVEAWSFSLLIIRTILNCVTNVVDNPTHDKTFPISTHTQKKDGKTFNLTAKGEKARELRRNNFRARNKFHSY